MLFRSSAISILNNKGDRTNPYGNGDADEVDETNVSVPDGFTQPIFNVQPLLVERQFHDDRVGMKLGGGKESEGKIATPLKEHLGRFEGAEVCKVERFVNEDSGREASNVTVRLVEVLVVPRKPEGKQENTVNFGSQIVERWGWVLDRKVFLLGSYSSSRYVETPHSSQHAHSRETHVQRVVTEREVWRVGVDADGSLSLLDESGDTGVRDGLGG